MRGKAYLGVAALAATLILTGCTGTATTSPAVSSAAGPSTSPGDGASGGPSSGGAGSATATPGPSATTKPTAKPTKTAEADPHHDHGTVPTSCKATMSAATYAKTFASTPLNPAGYDLKGKLGLLPASAQTSGRRLECLWRDPRADITNLDMVIAPVDPVKAVAFLTGLKSKGFTCVPLGEGTRCQSVTTDSQYGVEIGSTYYVRGSTGVYISQANFPTNGLLNEVIARVW